KNLFFLLKSLSSELSNGSILEALITDFFGLEIDKRVHKESIIANFYDLFLKWNEYAKKKEYNKLFQSIINDTGIFFRLIEKDDGERSLTNYKHILQNLLLEAERSNLSINQIVNLLKNYIEKYVAVEESEELHRQETEEKKVKILTIHASKGLEFPIVFMFAGFTTQKKDGNLDYYKFHRDERIFYDLSKDKSNLAENNRYEEFEKKRLYYVAITRAIFKLYIPLIKKNDNFLTNSLLDLNNPSIEYVDANRYDLLEKNITAKEIKERLVEKEYSIPENLFYFADRNIKKRKDSLLSFSGLKREIDNYKKFSEISLKDDENDEVAPQKNDLPPGVLTGNMFHKILESIDYSIFKNFNSYKDIKKDDETEKIITEGIEEYLFGYTKKDLEKVEIFKEAIYKRLFNVLNEPLNKDGFKLNLLEKKERLNEVEFYYPLPKSNNLTVEKISHKNGFLFGFIDMIFRIEEKYYILDWKSNSYDNYSGESFYQKVKTEYNLQYKLYSIALLKFLKNNLKDFDYDKNFGGVYYVYIRGKTSSCDEGVFFERELIDPQIKYEEELLVLIKN
ncbi:MAG TPA: 3'-5' exonuclease, partial [Spirochaetota bacterium]|nr:3'-5' exonuclease [Spirochaetota bacterium]